MKHISILIPEGTILGSLEGTRQLFSQVNNFYKMRGEVPVFDIKLVGVSKEIRVGGGLFTVHADHLLHEVEKTDLIIIPAVDGDLKEALEINKKFLPWIAKQYNQGSEVASLCLGAFLMAASGILDGKRCATHWLAEEQFRQMFPQVNLVTEKIITDEYGIYSSGGAFSYLNLILYLIKKYVGQEMAVLCAKVFAIEIERENQLSFVIFQGQKGHEDDTVKKAQEFIEKNYQERISVEQLTEMFAVGRRNFERRFKKATSNTVVEYIQRVKIEAAKKFLESGKMNVNEVMYDVGYSDTKAFRTTFRKVTGLSPLEYRNKYKMLEA